MIFVTGIDVPGPDQREKKKADREQMKMEKPAIVVDQFPFVVHFILQYTTVRLLIIYITQYVYSNFENQFVIIFRESEINSHFFRKNGNPLAML